MERHNIKRIRFIGFHVGGVWGEVDLKSRIIHKTTSTKKNRSQ